MSQSTQERKRKLAFARRMVEVLENALLTGGAVVSVSTDGVSVTYNRKQAIDELQMWRKEVTRYSRDKSRTSNIRLDTAHD